MDANRYEGRGGRKWSLRVIADRLGAGVRKAPPGTSEEQWKVLSGEREVLVRDLTNLPQNAYIIVAPTNTHHIHTENPNLIAEAIERVMKLSRVAER